MRMEDDVGRMRKDGIREEDGERRMTMMWRIRTKMQTGGRTTRGEDE